MQLIFFIDLGVMLPYEFQWRLQRLSNVYESNSGECEFSF